MFGAAAPCDARLVVLRPAERRPTAPHARYRHGAVREFGEVIRSDIGGGNADRITIRGHDLVEDLIDRHDFVDVVCLELLGRFPEPSMRRMVNALLVASSDHGLTPSVIAARLTLHGAPESLQGAVAAGLLGAGSRYLGTAETAAEVFKTALAGFPDLAPERAAADLVAARHAARQPIPGIGHPIHADVDPRTEKLLSVAAACGFAGRHVALARAVANIASERFSRKMPLNAAGASAAVILDMNMPPSFAKALALIGRTAGLLAHLLEEQERPIAQSVWEEVEARAADRAGPDK